MLHLPRQQWSLHTVGHNALTTSVSPTNGACRQRQSSKQPHKRCHSEVFWLVRDITQTPEALLVHYYSTNNHQKAFKAASHRLQRSILLTKHVRKPQCYHPKRHMHSRLLKRYPGVYSNLPLLRFAITPTQLVPTACTLEHIHKSAHLFDEHPLLDTHWIHPLCFKVTMWCTTHCA